MLDHDKRPERRQPPIGGANLECLLAFNHLDLEHVEAVCDLVCQKHFTPRPNNGIVVIDESFFMTTYAFSTWTQFLELLKGRSFPTIFLNLKGSLADLEVEISLGFFFHFRVIQISAPEDLIWGFTEDRTHASFNRIQSFFELCEQICSIQTPRFAAIGSEPCTPQEISAINETEGVKFHFDCKEFFLRIEKKNYLIGMLTFTHADGNMLNKSCNTWSAPQTTPTTPPAAHWLWSSTATPPAT